VLHTDVKPGDRVFYFTTCGWMMWNWLVSGAGRRRDAAALRRLALHPDGNGAVRLRRRRGHDPLRHLGQVHRRRAKAGSSRARPQPRRPCAPSARPARRWSPRASTTSTRIKPPTCSSPRSRAAPTSSPASCSATRAAGVARRDPGARPRHGGRRVGRRRQAGARREGRARLHQALPVDAGRLLERPDGSKYHAAYFERFPNVWCHGDLCRDLTAHGG
jgi:acetoacetyl-CoA synthetase